MSTPKTLQEFYAVKELREALEELLKNPNLYPCRHESTHRGGAIWEICDECGSRFADDEGGVPDYQEHPSITKAYEVLAKTED
jgi:hypothetical protein